MHTQAIQLYTVYKESATIKLPMTVDGLKVCNELYELGIRTNVTLVFNTAQAVMAAKANATYVSPFVGRIDDQGYAGLEVVRGIAALYRSTGMGTEVLAASIRTPHRAVRSFFNGASIVTMPPSVFWDMYPHVLTEQGLEIFENATNDD
jgi:transaldolase